MARKPVWKVADELRDIYRSRGVDYCYNQKNHFVYLSVLSAPIVAIGVDGCQLTGSLKLYGGVEASKNVDEWVEMVKHEYIFAWGENPEMLKFAETIR